MPFCPVGKHINPRRCLVELVSLCKCLLYLASRVTGGLFSLPGVKMMDRLYTA